MAALARRQDRLGAGEHPRTIGIQRVERAGGGQALDHALVDRARIHPRCEIRQRGEQPVLARLHDQFDRLRADAFEARQRVIDGAVADFEGRAGAIDRGRLDLDAEPLRLGAKFRELVGIAEVERHRRRQEFDRVMRLHVGGVVRHQRVGRGVALVEAVIGELRQQFEDGVGLAFRHVVLHGAGDEDRALLFHLRADLLAHRAAQQVGVAERIAGHHLGDLHHLFLVDDDAEGFLQDRLEHRMQIFRLLVAMLARAIGRDVRHRTRAIQRHQRDDVLETVGPHVDQRPPHALAFHLEHADHVAARQHLVARGIVERQGREIDLDVALLQQFHGDIEHGQRLQAEEVEFDEAGGLDPFHVELGHRHVGFRIAVERHQFAERPVRYHDAGGVGRGVPGQSLEPLRNVEGARHHRILVAKRLQLRLAGDGGRQRHRRRRILRHQLCQLIDLAIGHLQHAADVAQHAAGLQRSEGDDLRDLVATIALLHVIDHLAAPVLAEVDVEVGHRHAFRIEEALEQQAEPDRIEIGDGQGVGDQRACAGAAARPDRNALRPSPIG